MGTDTEFLPDLVESVMRKQGVRSWTVTPGEFWCRVDPENQRLRKQGWKLHVSATPLSAPLVLARATGVLIAERASFKFAGTLNRVTELVSAHCDRGGGGKFITVYPDDDDHFRRLAEALHCVTRGLPGPGILSDRPYRPGSLVHYRYGVFTRDDRLGNDGTLESMLEAPDGHFVRDRRLAWFSPPAWAPSPLPEPESKPKTRPATVLLAGRYIVQKAIRHANKGGVYVGTEQVTGRQVVIKEARRHVGAILEGTDASDLLRHEAEMHAALAPLDLCPKALGVFTQGGNLYLVQEYVDGETLRSWVAARPEPALAELLDLAGQLVAVVEQVHQAGYVLRDLNPGNLLVTPHGELRLIDLEMIARPGDHLRRAYTPGYAGPEVVGSEPTGPAPEQSSDLFSLGAVLFYLATGAETLLAADKPQTCTTGERLSYLVTRTLAVSAEALLFTPLVIGLAAEAASDRWSIAMAQEFLSGVVAGRPTARAIGAPSTALPTMGAEERLISDGITFLLDTMTPSDRLRLWPADGFGDVNDPLNVQYGAAGVLAVLTAAGSVRDDLRLRSGVAEAASWIAARPQPDAQALPGLYFGRSGTAWALLEAARLLADNELAESALRLARQVPVRWPNPDVCHGAAGAGLAQLHFWRTTGEPDFRARMIEVGEGLLAAAEPGRSGVIWPIPADFDSQLAGAKHLGFAHGVAGIGTFLLLAGLAADREDFIDLAKQAGDALVTAARIEGAGAWWPESDKGADEPLQMPYWCSGSSGVGTFLIRLWQATADPRYLDLAERAAADVYRRRWQLSPAACHGLAGNAEYLLDLAAVLGEPRYRRWAEELADCAHARNTLQDGLVILPDESMTGLSVGFNTGLSGALAMLLRLRYGGPRLWLPESLALPARAAEPAGAEARAC